VIQFDLYVYSKYKKYIWYIIQWHIGGIEMWDKGRVWRKGQGEGVGEGGGVGGKGVGQGDTSTYHLL
jgi:hypothetical protein